MLILKAQLVAGGTCFVSDLPALPTDIGPMKHCPPLPAASGPEPLVGGCAALRSTGYYACTIFVHTAPKSVSPGERKGI